MSGPTLASAVRLGILYGMVALGPALGFLMGSALLSKWINIAQSEPPNGITTNDPRWIGRWWAGFLVSASALTVLSFLLCTFPAKLPRDINQTAQSIDATQSTDSVCALGQAATRRHTLPKLSHPTQCKGLCQISKLKGSHVASLRVSNDPFSSLDIVTSITDLLMNFTYLLIVLINSVESVSSALVRTTTLHSRVFADPRGVVHHLHGQIHRIRLQPVLIALEYSDRLDRRSGGRVRHFHRRISRPSLSHGHPAMYQNDSHRLHDRLARPDRTPLSQVSINNGLSR